MTTRERLINYVFQFGKQFNCGQSILTLLPFILFVVYFWLFAETYIMTLIHPYNRPRHRSIPENQWGQCILMCYLWLKCIKLILRSYSFILPFQHILTMVLVWSGIHCWSYGLIRILNKNTFVFLTIINDSLNSNYKMNHTTVLALESYLKLAVCCLVVYFIRDLYIEYDSYYHHHDQLRPQSRIYRYNWPTYIIQPERETNELGADGILLMFDNVNVHPRPENHPLLTENANTTKVRHTQSCILPRNTGKILGIKKRNSV